MWFRERLNELGCSDVMLTPFCKGDPAELTPLARLKVINAMPCACYGVSPPRLLKERVPDALDTTR